MEAHPRSASYLSQSRPQAPFVDQTDLDPSHQRLLDPSTFSNSPNDMAAYSQSAHDQLPPAHNAQGPYASQYPQYPDSGHRQDPVYDAPYKSGNEQSSQAGVSSRTYKPGVSKKTKRRLYWVIPLAIFVLVIGILFEVYKDDFERWAQPLTNWLTKREAWSWVIPVVILVILSIPPLFGHEIVQLIVGLAYPLGVAIGIACAGSILGEAFCFVVFKLFGTKYVERKIATKVKWAAIARVAQEAGFKGVLVIRYSIVPPHLANPLFACTGMSFWLYMITVILSLPKSIVFVALGSPGSKNNKGVKWAKVVALAVLVAVTIFASIWIRRMLKVATEDIERERGITHEEEDKDIEMDGISSQVPPVKDNAIVG